MSNAEVLHCEICNFLKNRGTKLKELRRRLKLTQKQLSSQANLTQKQISLIENGHDFRMSTYFIYLKGCKK
jgi:transcriptional regulator with XRE-family HTH domain